MNQIKALDEAGYFGPRPERFHTHRALADIEDTTFSPEYRVRSYLEVNCAHCHHPTGPALGSFDARITTPTAEAGLIEGALEHQREADGKVIVPGAPESSELLRRLTIRGHGQMPPVGSTVLDESAIEAVQAWVGETLPAEPTFAEWQQNHFDDPAAGEAAADADPDNDRAVNRHEYLLQTAPLSNADRWEINIAHGGDEVRIQFEQVANLGFELQATSQLADPESWEPVDVPGNRPFFFSATDRAAEISEAIEEQGNKYYRVRVREP